MTYEWNQVKANKGSAGIDKMTFQYIREEYRENRIFSETCGQLKNGTYRPLPVQRVDIPRGKGEQDHCVSHIPHP